MRPGIDRTAMINGVITIVILAIPLGLIAEWFGNQGARGLALTCNLAALGAFILGAGVSAWAQRNHTPIAHGIVAALLAQAVITAISVAASLLRGTQIAWFGQFFLFTLALVCGVIGGLIGGRMRQQGLIPRSERETNASVED